MSLLHKILVRTQELTSKRKQSLIVFDLDSTLFDVSPRLERILLDFAAIPVNQRRFPEQIALFKDIRALRTDWGIKNALQRAGLDGNHPEFQEAVKSYWQKNFFSNHYLQFDRPYEGAIEYVQALHKAGATIAYLTGRDVERMGTGSIEVMKEWRFPMEDRAELVLKPHRSIDDAEFKSNWFLKAQKMPFSSITFFENEPVNLHHLIRKCPSIEMVFFDSTHSGLAHPPENIPRIMNFLLDIRE